MEVKHMEGAEGLNKSVNLYLSPLDRVTGSMLYLYKLKEGTTIE